MNNLEIARKAPLRPIADVAWERLGIPGDALENFGKFKAKIALDHIDGAWRSVRAAS